MPRVPYSPVPGVVPGLNPNVGGASDYQEIGANPAEFGAQVGAAEEQGAQEVGAAKQQLGASLGALGEQGARQVIAFQGIQNETTARDLAQATRTKMNDLFTSYSTLNGKAAVDAYPEFQKNLNDAYSNAIDNAPNPEVRQLMASSLSFSINRLGMYSMDHYKSADKQWQQESLMGNAAASAADAVRYNTDPAQIAKAVADAEDAGQQIAVRIGGAPAGSPYAITQGQKYVGNTVSQIIDAQLAQGPDGVARAQQTLATYKGQMDAASIARIEAAMKPKIDSEVVTSTVHGLLAPYTANGTQQGFANNLGNLKATDISYDGKGSPYQAGSGTFETFGTEAQGAKAWYQNLPSELGKTSGGTLSQVLNILTPPSENNTQLYIAQVSRLSGIAPDAKIDVNNKQQMVALLGAVAKMEKGVSPDMSQVAAGYDAWHDHTTLPGAPPPSDSNRAGVEFPDVSALSQKVMNNPSLTDEQKFKVMAGLRSGISDLNTMVSAQRQQLEAQLKNDSAAALNGVDIPDRSAEINRLFPPEQAQAMLHGLMLDQISGGIITSSRWATPEELAATEQQLSTGLGPAADMVKSKLNGPGGGGTGTSDDYTARMQVFARFEQMKAVREKMLQTDPALYVQSNPQVLAARQALAADPSNPALLQAWANTTYAVESHLGVTNPAQQSLLPDQQLKAEVSRIQQTDASQGDELGRFLQQFGGPGSTVAQKVFGGLVKNGLNPDYQTLANIPVNSPVRGNFQNALLTRNQKGGLEMMGKDIDQTTRKTIDNGGIDNDPTWQQFVKTAGGLLGTPNNSRMIAGMKDSVTTMAYYLAMKGDSNPVADATNMLLGQRYDFDNYMRVPKGLLPQVTDATNAVMANLKGNISVINPDPRLAVNRVNELGADEVRRHGIWMTNQTDNGVVLMVPQQAPGSSNVVYRQALHPDGTPIQVTFDDARRGVYPTAVNGTATTAPVPPPHPGILGRAESELKSLF